LHEHRYILWQVCDEAQSHGAYGGDPLPAVKNAIRNRHTHKGFMAEYKLALALVRRALETGDEPIFGSWF
jgi:hypothetical protein